MLDRLADTPADELLLAEHGFTAFATESTIVVPDFRGTDPRSRRVESMDSFRCEGTCNIDYLAYVCEQDDGSYELSATAFPANPELEESTVSLGNVGTGVQWIWAFQDNSEVGVTGALAVLDSGIVMVSYPDGEVTRLTDDPSDRDLSQGVRGVFFVRGFGADAAVYHHTTQGVERVFSGDGAISGSPQLVVQTDGPTIRVANLSGVLEEFEQPGLVFRQPAAVFKPIGYGE